MNIRRTQIAARGFTLIEVLLVILIIGMLAAVLAVTIGGTQERAKVDTTRLTVQKIESKIQTYYMHVGHFPTEAEGGLQALVRRPSFDDENASQKWAGPYVKTSELKDAWGNDLQYEASSPGESVAPGVDFKVWSNGPDLQSNTADDISNFEEAEN